MAKAWRQSRQTVKRKETRFGFEPCLLHNRWKQNVRQWGWCINHSFSIRVEQTEWRNRWFGSVCCLMSCGMFLKQAADSAVLSSVSFHTNNRLQSHSYSPLLWRWDPVMICPCSGHAHSIEKESNWCKTLQRWDERLRNIVWQKLVSRFVIIMRNKFSIFCYHLHMYYSLGDRGNDGPVSENNTQSISCVPHNKRIRRTRHTKPQEGINSTQLIRMCTSTPVLFCC